MIFNQQNNKIFNDIFNDIFQNHYFCDNKIMIAIIKIMIAIIKIMIAIIISENIICYH